jgi:hypothetical protein
MTARRQSSGPRLGDAGNSEAPMIGSQRGMSRSNHTSVNGAGVPPRPRSTNERRANLWQQESIPMLGPPAGYRLPHPPGSFRCHPHTVGANWHWSLNGALYLCRGLSRQSLVMITFRTRSHILPGVSGTQSAPNKRMRYSSGFATRASSAAIDGAIDGDTGPNSTSK